MSPGNGVGGRPRQTATPEPSALTTDALDEGTALLVLDAATERWRPVPGYRGTYEVSDHGVVRSLDRSVETVRGLRRVRGRALRPCLGSSGYPQVTLCLDGRERTARVHVLVLSAWVGPRPAGAQSCHASGDRSDNRRVNLSWCSPVENAADQRRHGTNARTRRTHCPREHVLRAPNLVRSQAGRGYRECRACHRTRSRAYRLRRNGIRLDEPMLRAIADRALTEIIAETEGAAA